MDYGGNGATMNEVERNLKLSDSVLRYLSVLVDKEVDVSAARAEIEAHRRRAAEARAAAEAARAAAEAARAAAAEQRAATAAAEASGPDESSGEETVKETVDDGGASDEGSGEQV
jgi:small subunit ribosomal protein S6